MQKVVLVRELNSCVRLQRQSATAALDLLLLLTWLAGPASTTCSYLTLPALGFKPVAGQTARKLSVTLIRHQASNHSRKKSGNLETRFLPFFGQNSEKYSKGSKL